MDLRGKWKFRRAASDDPFRGLAPITGIPAIALFSHDQGEFMEISLGGSCQEEICLTMSSTHDPQMNITRYFQLGKLSYHDFANISEPSAACIVDCTPALDRFSFLWMGPALGQRTIAHFRLNEKGTGLKAEISIFSPSAGPTPIKIVKNFTATSMDRPPSSPTLLLAEYTRNWVNVNTHSQSELSMVKLKGLGAVDIRMLKNEKEFVDSDKAAELGALPLFPLRRHKDKFSEGSVVQFFVIRVTKGDFVWNVLHRYREFESLHDYILLQTEDMEHVQIPPLPGKSIFRLGEKGTQDRLDQLVTMMRTVVAAGAYKRPNVADAMFAFLEIPEHQCREFLSEKSDTYAYLAAMADDVDKQMLKKPQDVLHARLRPGFPILKHSSRSFFSSKPSKKLLTCDHGVTMLSWIDDGGKRASDSMSTSAEIGEKKLYIRDVLRIGRKADLSSRLLKKRLPDAQVDLCFSIFTHDRTLDIQCHSKADFDFLFSTIEAVVSAQMREST